MGTVSKTEIKSKTAVKPGADKQGVLERLTAVFKKRDKKTLQIAVAVVLIVIVLIIYFSTLFPSSPKGQTDTEGSGVLTASEYREKTSRELEAFLTGIKGAGKVKVLINFDSSVERVIAYITNNNRNAATGEDGRTTESTQSSSSPVILNQNGVQTPLVLREIYPEVLGVIVGAEGAGDTKVRLALTDAVRTYLNIPADSVQVYPLGK
jgi:stage III sporulation protein AG